MHIRIMQKVAELDNSSLSVENKLYNLAIKNISCSYFYCGRLCEHFYSLIFLLFLCAVLTAEERKL